jgi:hypothetical protein
MGGLDNMKRKCSFVTNSSSTAYMITNKTDKVLDLIQFVKENPQLITKFIEYYDWDKDNPKYTQYHLIRSASENNRSLKPGSNYCVFGDEDETIIGTVFDYILRNGGSSENFDWEYVESLR